MTAEQARVYNAIPVGGSKAKKLKELCLALGYPTDGRKLRDVFEELNYLEHPVVNLRNGYFRPETAKELAAYCKINHSYKRKFEKKDYHLRRALMNFGAEGMELCGEIAKPRRKAL